MNAENIIALVVSIGLAAYLITALVFPDKF